MEIVHVHRPGVVECQVKDENGRVVACIAATYDATSRSWGKIHPDDVRVFAEKAREDYPTADHLYVYS